MLIFRKNFRVDIISDLSFSFRVSLLELCRSSCRFMLTVSMPFRLQPDTPRPFTRLVGYPTWRGATSPVDLSSPQTGYTRRAADGTAVLYGGDYVWYTQQRHRICSSDSTYSYRLNRGFRLLTREGLEKVVYLSVGSGLVDVRDQLAASVDTFQ